MIELIELPRWLLELIAASVIVSGCAVVVLERREPSTTITWILAIFVLPVVGLLLYIVFGRRPLRRVRRRARKRAASAFAPAGLPESFDGKYDGLGPVQRGLVRLALTTSDAPLLKADRVGFFAGGDSTWSAIRESIEDARESVSLEFYIWRDDHAGTRMVSLLADRARAGVRVRVLYDPIGSVGLSRDHFAPLLDAGGEVATAGLLLSRRWFTVQTNYRNHRKIIAIDRSVGFVGGINIASEYLEGHPEAGGWQDVVARIEGEAVSSLEAIFQEDWFDATGESSRPVIAPESQPAPESARPIELGAPLVQVIPSGPDARASSALSAQINAAIANAQERCWIATPYLIPDEPLRLTLATTAMRGVDLRLLVPQKSDHLLVTLAAHSYFDRLLAAGCRIYEYPQMFHAKYLLVDDWLAVIGSANMDVRSFHLNYEAIAMFYSENVNRDLAALYEDDLARARPVDRAKVSRLVRTGEAFARVLSPLL